MIGISASITIHTAIGLLTRRWKLSDGAIWIYPIAIGISRDDALGFYDLEFTTDSPPFDNPMIGLELQSSNPSKDNREMDSSATD